MRYKDLKEMTIKDWDGKPFRAIVTDNDEETLSPITDVGIEAGTCKGCLVTGYDKGTWWYEEVSLVTGYDRGTWWCGEVSLHFKHAYPVKWNNKPKKRMTNRQLAMWLAKGNGEYTSDRTVNSCQSHNYCKSMSNDFVDKDIRVRKWDSEEWIEPTIDLLEDW